MYSKKLIFKNLRKRAGIKNPDYYILLSIGLVLMYFLAGCSQTNPAGPSSSTAIVKGRVESNTAMNKVGSTGSGVQGATVILAEVRSDGSLETISNAAVQTDIDGNFSLETNMNNLSDLVVIANKDSSQWMAVVSSSVNSSSTVYVRPLNDETTVMASVYIRAKADNYSNVTYPEIDNYINSKIAAQIKSNSALIGETAASLNAEANAEYESASEMGLSQSQWQAIINDKYNAQASLDEQLYNSSAPDDSNAYESYYQALVNAYINAGASADTYAKLLIIANSEFVKSTSNLNSQLSFYFEQSAAYLRAKVTNYAVQEKFNAMGASNAEIEAAAAAGLSLSSSIKNASAQSDIDNSFSNYRTQIVAELKMFFNSNQEMVTAISSKAQLYNSTFKSDVSSGSSTNDIISAYNKFYSGINSSVAASFGSGSQSQINDMTDMMVIVYGS